MNKRKYSLITGTVVILVTVLLYMGLVRNFFKFPMAYISLFSVLLSELISFGALVGLTDGRRRIVTSVVFAAQALITAMASVIYINIFVLAYVGFAVTYFISFAAAASVCLLLFKFTSRSIKANKEFKSAKINMVSMRAVVNGIINSEDGAKYSKQLTALDENLRFSDDSVIDEMDSMIYDKLNELADRISDPEFDAEAAIRSINGSIKQRNFIVKNKKAYN